MVKKEAPDEGAGSNTVTTETLAEVVADEELDYPDGAPTLIPMLALPRMRRADAYEALGQITTYQRQVRTAAGEPVTDDESVDGDVDTADGRESEQDKPQEIDPATYGAQYRVVAYVEEYLRVVAANGKVFDVWAAQVDDADLIKTFNVYLRKTQPGEAESSAG